jgi:hypothetical protein
MSNDTTRSSIEATAKLLGLEIRPEWQANVEMFFDVARGMAERVDKTGARSAVEQAPIFTPRAVE